MAPEKYVSDADLRTYFNDGRYYERMQDGEFLPEVTEVGPAPARFPARVRSQIVAYVDQTGMTIAIVHQYGYENGDIAEGTRPDPKFLFKDGVRYKRTRG